MHKGLRDLMIIVSLMMLGLWVCGLSMVKKSITYISQKNWIHCITASFYGYLSRWLFQLLLSLV